MKAVIQTERNTDDRRDQLEKEIDPLGQQAWAGKYYHGDGLHPLAAAERSYFRTIGPSQTSNKTKG